MSHQSGLAFFIGFSLVTKTVLGQDIAVDSKENSVFSFYTFEEYRYSASADKPFSISSSFFRFVTRNTAVGTLANSAPLVHAVRSKTDAAGAETMKKLSGFVLTLSMLNSEDDFLKFNRITDLKPGGQIKFGWHSTILDYQDIKYVRRSVTYGANLIGQIDNLTVYDPADLSTHHRTPLSGGVEGYLNTYPLAFNPFKLFLCFNGSYLNSWNDDELIKYQQISSVITNTKSTVVAMEDFEGRYGTLKTDLNNYRFSISLPIYFWYVSIVPYISWYISDNQTPNHNIGGFVNILQARFTIEEAELPSSLGIGLDYNFKGNEVSPPNFFLKGTIGFAKLR